ncbi:dynein light chain LC8-type [Sarotherodon galilaeus]
MLDRCYHKLLLFGCLACLLVTVVSADGRVFVLDLRNSSDLRGFRDAEQACASHRGRLASVEELWHAVVECYFSPCTRGWLYGGSVGTTVCNVVGGVLKAVEVRTENGTEDAAHLDAFCIKDKDEPCGDPPSFPNARLQSHSGSEMGDELLYTCVPGYVMPGGNTAFSLLCDSCGEWYGLVQICVKDEVSHTDYEDKFTDSYIEAERHPETPSEAHGDVHEEVYGAAYPHGEMSVEQQETSFRAKAEEDHRDLSRKRKVGEEVAEGGKIFEGALVEQEKNDERAGEDLVSPRTWQQERTEVAKIDTVEATEAPVSLLSQKHMFWFPSETFQEEGPQVFTNPATQTTQRTSVDRSEESIEHTSQERPYRQHPIDADDPEHEGDDFDDPDTSRHDDQDDIHEDDHHDDQDGSHQEEDHDEHKRQPAQDEDLDKKESRESYDDHEEHYDMGEHEEDRDRKEYDDPDDTYDGHKSQEDDDDHNGEHHEVSEEHLDHDDHDDRAIHYDDTHYADLDDRDDFGYKDAESYDDHDSHEDDSRQHVIFSVVADEHQNVTQRGAEGKSATDDTWLDGYPVVFENGDSVTEKVKPEDKDRRRFFKTTPIPTEVEIRRPYTSSPKEHESLTTVREFELGVLEEVWPDSIGTPAPDLLEPSDSPSYSETGDYSTQQAVPTDSWMADLTDHPFLDHGPSPPVHKDGFVLSLPGETGERGEQEGEMEETICVDDACPPLPPSSSGRGPTVAAIIVAICVVATAVIVAVWCYRRQQQKSSAYEMNGKGQSQARQGQQIEMQQKV